MDISSILKKKRRDHKLTQEQLAEKIFVSTKTISNWENNKTTPDIDSQYDYIIFDVPPTLISCSDSAMVASDYIVIVLPTQERSCVGAEAFIQYTQQLYDTYKSQVDSDILGVLSVLLKNTSKVDQTILEQAKTEFGEENIFNNVIKNMERVKRYDMIGITNPDNEKRQDMNDKKYMLFILK